MENKETIEVLLKKIEELTIKNTKLEFKIAILEKLVDDTKEITKDEIELELGLDGKNNAHMTHKDAIEVIKNSEKFWNV